MMVGGDGEGGREGEGGCRGDRDGGQVMGGDGSGVWGCGGFRGDCDVLGQGLTQSKLGSPFFSHFFIF